MRENQELRKQIKKIGESYDEILADLDSISELNQEYRTIANLEPITEEERLLGIGGSENNFITRMNIRDQETIELLNWIDDMTRTVEFEKAQTKEISNQLSQNKLLFENIPAIQPVKGNYSMRGFGVRRHPILGINKFHTGLDINSNTGTQVHAPGNGKIILVQRQAGYGLVIQIDHDFGYKTIYAHLSKTLVKKGQKVKRGDVIALTGNSGLSSGPHLHYEVRHNGKVLDPTDFFFDDLTLFDSTKTTISTTEK
jgi:murein DD-endopeptidase MepM/ murein hydrolase activator NlpD